MAAVPDYEVTRNHCAASRYGNGDPRGNHQMRNRMRGAHVLETYCVSCKLTWAEIDADLRIRFPGKAKMES